MLAAVRNADEAGFWKFIGDGGNVDDSLFSWVIVLLPHPADWCLTYLFEKFDSSCGYLDVLVRE
jgi:hypothetical protein